jgi:hypothetical protein
LGAGAPIVFCVLDWTGVLNAAHLRWRTVLAEAAGTTPDRVALHSVHQHNAPFVCFDAGERIARQADLPKVFEMDFFQRCLDASRSAVQEAVRRARPVTHIAQGGGRVVEVAGNRRLQRDGDAGQREPRRRAGRHAGGPDRPDVAHRGILRPGNQDRRVPLLRDPPDELLR